MGNRRFVPTSDDEDNSPPPRNPNGDEKRSQRKRKKVQFPDEEEDEDRDLDEVKLSELKQKKRKKREDPEPDLEPESENEEPEDLEALPVGDAVRVSGKGRGRRSHFASFEYDGLQYQLEDPVLLVPENGNQKPYVAIIKDVSQTREGAVMVTGQWFYRPEEAEKKGGGNWQSSDTRELFYSFHRDEVPAESVMHKCVVHFIPQNKQIPPRKQHPGFIVQKVYDTEQRRLFKLTDKDYEDNKQHEIDLLVQKTLARIGDLPDLEPEDATVEHEDPLKSKRLIRKRNVSPLDVTRVDGGLTRSQSIKAETPGSTCGTGSEYFLILSNLKLSTGETQRDRWLEKLLQSIQSVCSSDGKQKDEQDGNKNDGEGSENKLQDKGDASSDWPDTAAHAVAALEKVAHETLSADFQKYNQKMRQLAFNLKSNVVLARRLLNKELEPAQILNMSPNELKMTDARCSRCSLKQVALVEVFQTGHGDRYKVSNLQTLVGYFIRFK
ncbi:bromo-adjacent homology domain-containing family protein, partial [Striga asiatica]